MRRRTKVIIGCTAFGLAALGAWHALASASDNARFPDGYDAVQAAPGSHKVVFENALVRVLEVTIPANGQTEPIHHHRWPSFFLSWDTGGKSPHIRYHQPGGIVRDSPSIEEPVRAGHWSIHWMKPEPMHAIESVENNRRPGQLPFLRVEIKDAT
jgi:hypothetical protein